MEILNDSSNLDLNMYTLPPYLQSQSETVAKFLYKIYQFQSQNRLIPYYVNFQFPKEQEQMFDFWKNIGEQVVRQLYKFFEVNTKDFLNMFKFGTFEPIGLETILRDLIENEVYIDSKNSQLIDKHLGIVPDQQSDSDKGKENINSTSFLKQITTNLNPFNFFKKPTPLMPLPNTLIQIDYLQQRMNIIYNLIQRYFEDKPKIIEPEQLVFAFLKQNGVYDAELQQIITYLQRKRKLTRVTYTHVSGRQDRAIVIMRVEMSQNQIEKEKICFQLSMSIQYFEAKRQKILESISIDEEEMKKLLRTNQRELAQDIFRQMKFLEGKVKELNDKIFVFQKTSFEIEDTATNQGVYETMKSVNSILNNNQIDIDALNDAQIEFDMMQEENKETQKIFENFNQGHQQELEREYENYFNEVNGYNVAKNDNKMIDISDSQQKIDFNIDPLNTQFQYQQEVNKSNEKQVISPNHNEINSKWVIGSDQKEININKNNNVEGKSLLEQIELL